jgi:hypothetical protein
MSDVDFYIGSLEDENLRTLVSELHELILSQLPSIYAELKYGIPFYNLHSWMCYINPLKTGGVELCFLHGQKLPDTHHLLETKGRKMVSGITITTIQQLYREDLLELILSAIILDEEMKKEKK